MSAWCRRFLSCWLVLLATTMAVADVSVLPTEGKSAAVVSSSTPGRWIVFQAAPFGVVPNTQMLVDRQAEVKALQSALTQIQSLTSNVDAKDAVDTLKAINALADQVVGGTFPVRVYCVWQGDAGTYTAALFPTDAAAPFEYGTVTLGEGQPEPDPKPEPEPDPEPDPQPEPGPRKVVVVQEENDATAYLDLAYKILRQTYVDTNNHSWGMYDPDQLNRDGQTSPWLKTYLEAAKTVGLPALVVATLDGKTVIASYKFPDAGDTVPEAETAARKAIELVKEAGG